MWTSIGTFIYLFFHKRFRKSPNTDFEVKFKKLVDKTHPSVNIKLNNNLMELYKHFGIESTGSYSRQTIEDFIKNKIIECLESKTGQTMFEVIKLVRHQFILKKLINQIELQPYLSILDKVFEQIRLNENILDINNTNAWQRAIVLAKDLDLIRGYNNEYTEDQLLNLYPQQYNSAQAAIFFQNKKYKFTIKDGRIFLDTKTTKRIVERIEKNIKTIGGEIVAQTIFKLISTNYCAEQERFHLGRRLPSIPRYKEASIPWGFLLNLSVKNLIIPNKILIDNSKVWEEIISLSRHLIAIYELEPYNVSEYLVISSPKLLDFLIRIKLYDGFFTLLQSRPKDILKILKGLFDWVDEDIFKSKYGYSLSQLIILIQNIISLTQQHTGLVLINRNLMIQHLDVSELTLEKMLSAISHGVYKANYLLALPNDLSKEDFSNKSLLMKNENEYLLMDKSWCAPAYYESIASLIRSLDSNADEKIGLSMENFLRDELSKSNVNFCYGKYKISKGKTEECDLVIECSNTIIFIEMKKKALTRDSKRGSDVHILIDLCSSLLDSQIQINKHEINLKKMGTLNLVNNKGNYKLELSNRNIEKISLSHLDFGSLQDRTVIAHALRIIALSSFEVDSKEYGQSEQIKIKKINDKARVLYGQILELIDLDKHTSQSDFYKNTPFFNCWYLSLPQLLVILDNVNCNESFLKTLNESKHLTTQSLDFYFEHWYTKNL